MKKLEFGGLGLQPVGGGQHGEVGGQGAHGHGVLKVALIYPDQCKNYGFSMFFQQNHHLVTK